MGFCQECGCQCSCCSSHNSLDLHREIAELMSKLKKNATNMVHMEQDFVQSKEYADMEISKLQDELAKLRDKYDRLFEGYKKMQKVNHNLEEKLLTIVGTFDAEKTTLQQENAELTSKLVDSKVTICELEQESENYRNDCSLAVHLLQCKPSTFVSHRLNTLPIDLQDRVKSQLTQEQLIKLEEAPSEDQDKKLIRVPIATFPPTAMVYAVNRITPVIPADNVESVPTTLIAKVLTPPDVKRKPRRVYVCTKCDRDYMYVDSTTQTAQQIGLPASYNYSDSNGYSARMHATAMHPGIHRPRLNSTETEI